MEFTEFFDLAAPQLVRMCFLVTVDREAAADAAQEALSRAWREWDRVGAEDSDPGAWTRTVALNLCRTRWRRLSRHARFMARAHVTDSRVDDLPDIDLQQALRRLPVRQREAVILHYWTDLDIAACADAMGVSPGSVKQHLFRARRHLAAELGPTSLDLEVDPSLCRARSGSAERSRCVPSVCGRSAAWITTGRDAELGTGDRCTPAGVGRRSMSCTGLEWFVRVMVMWGRRRVAPGWMSRLWAYIPSLLRRLAMRSIASTGASTAALCACWWA